MRHESFIERSTSFMSCQVFFSSSLQTLSIGQEKKRHTQLIEISLVLSSSFPSFEMVRLSLVSYHSHLSFFLLIESIRTKQNEEK
jgi:hypothetical protein